jgi:uncharacterized protein (DUF433 family)
MQLEDYFEFEKFETPHGPVERIRIKGHRIAIEHVIELHKQGVSAEDIAKVHYPSLTLEEVYATLTYYLHNKAEVEEYDRRGEEIAEAYYQDYRNRGPDFLKEEAFRARPAEPDITGSLMSDML